MRNLVNISIGFLLFSCSQTAETGVSDAEFFFDENISSQGDGTFIYEGVPIKLVEEQCRNKIYSIQEIEQIKEDVLFRAKRIPTELYVAKENVNISDTDLENATEELKNEQIFYFEIEETMRQDIMKKYHADDYEMAVSYLSFDIVNDFMLLTSSGDSLKPSFSIYERNFHVAPYERLIIDFVGVKSGDDVQLIYRDELFGKGDLLFNFPKEKIVQNNVNEIL